MSVAWYWLDWDPGTDGCSDPPSESCSDAGCPIHGHDYDEWTKANEHNHEDDL